MECLITKLKANVDNSSLPILKEVIVKELKINLIKGTTGRTYDIVLDTHIPFTGNYKAFISLPEENIKNPSDTISIYENGVGGAYKYSNVSLNKETTINIKGGVDVTSLHPYISSKWFNFPTGDSFNIIITIKYSV